MTASFLDAWHVDRETFPHAGSDEERLRFAARYALLAPSGHNGQPWLFEVEHGVLTVRADRTRALPTIDPDHREMLVTCAAAARFAALGLTRFGYPPALDVLPDPADPDVVARLRLAGWVDSPGEHPLFDAILRRHSNRFPYERTPVQAGVLARLQGAAERHGCWATPVTEAWRIAECARLIGEGDRIKWRERAFREELAERLIPNRGSRRDGMPGYAFGVPGPLARLAPAVIRRTDLGWARALADRRLARATPALLILGTDRDDPSAWVSAGFAMADVLLQATSEDLATGFLSQTIEVPQLRPRLLPLLGREGFPQLLLRVGYCTRRPRPSPRRPLEEVLRPARTARTGVR
jgi:nitroreductase